MSLITNKRWIAKKGTEYDLNIDMQYSICNKCSEYKASTGCFSLLLTTKENKRINKLRAQSTSIYYKSLMIRKLNLIDT